MLRQQAKFTRKISFSPPPPPLFLSLLLGVDNQKMLLMEKRIFMKLTIHMQLCTFLYLIDSNRQYNLWYRFEEQEAPGSRSFFTEIIASISDIKFGKDGRYILSRDYMTLKVWSFTISKFMLLLFKLSQYFRLWQVNP